MSSTERSSASPQSISKQCPPAASTSTRNSARHGRQPGQLVHVAVQIVGVEDSEMHHIISGAWHLDWSQWFRRRDSDLDVLGPEVPGTLG